MIPPLPLSSKVQYYPLKQAAVISGVFSQVADTTSLRKNPSPELIKLANQGRVKNLPKHHKSLSHTGTPSNSDEDHSDLRGALNELHKNRRKSKTPNGSQRSVKAVCENKSKPYNASPRQYGYDHKGTSAKSDRERSGLPDDDRRPQWDSTLEYEHRDNTGPHRRFRLRNRHLSKGSTGSDSDGPSNCSTRNRDRESDQTRERYGQENPTQIRRDRGGGMNRQQ